MAEVGRLTGILVQVGEEHGVIAGHLSAIGSTVVEYPPQYQFPGSTTGRQLAVLRPENSRMRRPGLRGCDGKNITAVDGVTVRQDRAGRLADGRQDVHRHHHFPNLLPRGDRARPAHDAGNVHAAVEKAEFKTSERAIITSLGEVLTQARSLFDGGAIVSDEHYHGVLEHTSLLDGRHDFADAV